MGWEPHGTECRKEVYAARGQLPLPHCQITTWNWSKPCGKRLSGRIQKNLILQFEIGILRLEMPNLMLGQRELAPGTQSHKP